MNNEILANLLIGVIGIIVFFFILKWPFIGVAVTISILPIVHIFPDIPLFTSISVPVGVATLASYLLQSKRKQTAPKGKPEPVLWFGFLFIFWTVVSNPEASFLGADRVWLLTFVQLWVLMYLTGELLVTPKRQETTMLIFAVVSMISAIFAVLQGEIAEDALSSARVAGLAVNANQAARYYVVAFVCFYFLRSTMQKPFLRFLYFIGILTTFVGIFFTVSRTGILLLFVSSILLLWFQPRVKNKIGLIVFLIVGLLGISFYSESIINIIRGIFPAIREGTDTIGLRYDLWQAGWKMWLDYPVQGIGIGQYPPNLLYYMRLFEGAERSGLSPHNSYVHVLAETGLVGFALFMAMLISAFKNLWPHQSRDYNQRNSIQITWFIILIILCVGSITASDLGNKLLWVLLGISAVYANPNMVEEEDKLTEAAEPVRTTATSLRLRRWMKNVK